jgi:hypothetical protein
LDKPGEAQRDEDDGGDSYDRLHDTMIGSASNLANTGRVGEVKRVRPFRRATV